MIRGIDRGKLSFLQTKSRATDRKFPLSDGHILVLKRLSCFQIEIDNNKDLRVDGGNGIIITSRMSVKNRLLFPSDHHGT